LWRQQGLGGLQAVYLWADGVYVKAGLEEEKAAILVVVLGLRDRGLADPCLAVADGVLGLWSAVTEIFPTTREQRCWNHKVVNALDQVPKNKQAEAKAMVTALPYCQTRQEVEKDKQTFEGWCGSHGFAKAAENLGRDWERTVSFYDFPKEHWKHIPHHQRRRVPFRCPSTSHRCGQEVQEGRECNSSDLEGVEGRAEEIPEARRPGTFKGRLCGCEIR
jgi:putative transposase